MKFALLLLASALPAATLHYWIDLCTPHALCRPGDPELARWALEAWQQASAGKLTFRPAASRDKAQIRVYWADGRQGLYGEAQPIVVDGVPGAEIYVVTPAAETSDPLLRDAIVYLTCLHESGHALGLNHTLNFDDIMYSFQYGGDITEYFARYRRKLKSREDMRKTSALSPADLKALAEIFMQKH
jgi:hypothetical protein